MTKPISQREARALKRRVKELEQRDRDFRRAIGSQYPGVRIARGQTDDKTDVLSTARATWHVVVVRVDAMNHMNFYAVPTEARANV